MPIITLLTDFGTKDSFIGVMKGVIWSIAPEVQIADLTHEISAQSVLEGALVLAQSVDYFPAGTVHVAVVDPGVGTARRGLAARIGSQYYVGPDNGLFSSVLAAAEARGQSSEFYSLDRKEFWLPVISRSFHGRDVFAPVAAHLAHGTPLAQLGTPLAEPVRLMIPVPQQDADGGLTGQVLTIDHFGNLLTNLKPEHVQGAGKIRVSVGGAQIDGIVQTFGEKQPGELVAMIDSSNVLQIAVVNGNAAERLGAKIGTIVKLGYN
jgi:Uncharacterized conserved protein